jgi:hypothetical protein
MNLNSAEVAAAECAQLEGECDILCTQVAQATFTQRRDALQAQLDSAMSKRDLKQMGTLGLALEALKLEAAQLPLSEEEYLTLGARHAALMERVEAKGMEFARIKQYGLVYRMGVALESLKGLDVSQLSSPGDADPVYVEISSAAAASTMPFSDIHDTTSTTTSTTPSTTAISTAVSTTIFSTASAQTEPPPAAAVARAHESVYRPAWMDSASALDDGPAEAAAAAKAKVTVNIPHSTELSGRREKLVYIT